MYILALQLHHAPLSNQDGAGITYRKSCTLTELSSHLTQMLWSDWLGAISALITTHPTLFMPSSFLRHFRIPQHLPGTPVTPFFTNTKDPDALLVSEMPKKWGSKTSFRRYCMMLYLKEHPSFKKLVYFTPRGTSVCWSNNIANECLECNFLCQILYEWFYWTN